MKTLLIILLLSSFCVAQQIEITPLFDFRTAAAYNSLTKKVYLHWQDAEAVKKFLHELGHHIWFYGGIDTLEFIESTNMFDFTNAEIREEFANYHFEYWAGFRWNEEADSIYYKFWNREGTF